MLPLPLTVFNALALVTVIILASAMARWGYIFTQNVGDPTISSKLQWRILKGLLALTGIIFLAAIVNTFFAAVL